MIGKTLIIVDIDGTISDCSHRLHLAQAKLWDEFNEACTADSPHLDTLTLIGTLANDMEYMIVAVTGRSEKYRGLTEQWLKKHRMLSVFDIILMRPDGDWCPDVELKPRLLDEYFGGRDWVSSTWFVLEDRDKVVEMYRNLGLSVWQVRQGTY